MNNFFLWVLRNAAKANIAVEDEKKYLGREKALLNGQLYIQFESKKRLIQRKQKIRYNFCSVFFYKWHSYFRLHP